jgi:DNA-binding XRE family transcriptional regulator
VESLYVVQFSNGHIKVGRSSDARARIASHADRVACLGVEVSDTFTVECQGPSRPRELQLINACVEQAEGRYQNEWFTGLDFPEVCRWAHEAASLQDAYIPRESDGFPKRLRDSRILLGLTQAALGEGLGTNGRDLQKAAISSWEVGRTSPTVEQIRLLCQRLGVSADFLLAIEQKA